MMNKMPKYIYTLTVSGRNKYFTSRKELRTTIATIPETRTYTVKRSEITTATEIRRY